MLHTFLLRNRPWGGPITTTTMITRKCLWTLLCVALLILVSCVKAPELTLTSSSSLELSVDGSSGSITFTANRDWTVSCSDSWVTVSPSKGTASDGTVTVTVRCSANTTYEDRSATVTIRMEELSQSVTVRQPANLGIVLPTQAYNLTSDARSIEVEVKANVDYTVEISADWIKQAKTKALTSKTLTFNIEENQTYDAREGKITIKSQNPSVPDQVITVKQAQKDAIIVKDTSFDMPYGGGEIEFKVEANVAFDVKTDSDWIHYVSTKALSTSTVKLKIDENATFSARSGKVEVTQQGGSLKHTITVNQAGRIAVTSVELDKTELTLKPEETATLDATVKPDNATDKTVTWTSSDPEIATVDETGKVTAVKIGKATITAKAGEKTTECKVTVLIPVSSVELDKTTLELKPGETATLVATVKPDNATNKTVTWTSSDPEIATVDEAGKVTAVKDGDVTITAKAGEKTAECKVTVKSSVYVGNAVDLGITITRGGKTFKLLWADCNLGTDKPEGYGDYYAWGETEAKSDYSWSTYKWANGEYNKLTKYCPTDKTDYWDGAGSPDGKTVLDPEDDVAHVKLGGNWRMPTKAEQDALRSQCTWTWTTKNGVNGREVKSKVNSNSIFLPAAGHRYRYGYGTNLSYAGSYGYFWSSSLYTRPDSANDIYFGSDYVYWYTYYRFYGFTVRPVMETANPVTAVELDKTSLEMKPGETVNLVVTINPNNATDKTVTWTTSDASIASVDANGKVKAVKVGTATITAKVGEKSAECIVVVNGIPDGAVNLGIVITRDDGSKYVLYWAECNIGASKPEEFGDYYAWGETETKDIYTWETYKFRTSGDSYNVKLSKYNTSSSNGPVDKKTVLDPEDDVAHVKLGGKWRMPTKAEQDALRAQCTWTWTTLNGVNGYVVKSKVNSTSIFLPAAGLRGETDFSGAGSYGFYWSSSLITNYPYNAYEGGFDSDRVRWGVYDRNAGFTVRPVSE